MSRRAAGPLIRNSGLTAEINVTPLVDVCLVLLIIFMVTTPVLRAGFEAAVPPRADRGTPTAQLVVSLDANGTVAINSHVIAPGTLAVRLSEVLQEWQGRPTFVAVAGAVPYQKAVALMALCREVGATNLALVLDEMPPIR